MKKIFASLLIVMLIAGCVGQTKTNPYELNYAEKRMVFRADLNEAEKIFVEPSAEDLQNILMDPYVKGIKVAFVPSENDKFYAVSGFELAQKMQWVNMAIYGSAIPITNLILNKTEDAKRLASKEMPIVVMQGGVEETKVLVNGYAVYVRGKDMTEVKRDYTDLDLAADKLLLTLMDLGYVYKLINVN